MTVPHHHHHHIAAFKPYGLACFERLLQNTAGFFGVLLCVCAYTAIPLLFVWNYMFCICLYASLCECVCVWHSILRCNDLSCLIKCKYTCVPAFVCVYACAHLFIYKWPNVRMPTPHAPETACGIITHVYIARTAFGPSTVPRASSSCNWEHTHEQILQHARNNSHVHPVSVCGENIRMISNVCMVL